MSFMKTGRLKSCGILFNYGGIMAEKIVGINSIAEALAGKRKIHRITYDETRGGKRITELLEKAARQGIYCYSDRRASCRERV